MIPEGIMMGVVFESIKDIPRKEKARVHNTWGIGCYSHPDGQLMFRLYDLYEEPFYVCAYTAPSVFDSLKLSIDGTIEVYTRE